MSLLIAMTLSWSLTAQSEYIYNPNKSDNPLKVDTQAAQVRVFSNAFIDSLVAEHIRINEEEGLLSGYRIQIVSSSNLSGVKQVRSEFLDAYPAIEVNIVLESPNFKLRAGNYLDRFEAFHDLQLIVQEFKGAFIVKDLIEIADL